MASNYQQEDKDEEFIEHTKEIAKTFIDLYLLEELEKEGTIAGRSPNGDKSSLVPPTQDDIAAEASDDLTLQVANRLKAIGDQINDKIQGEMEKALVELLPKQGVWDIGYLQFSTICSNVLGVVNSGWGRVSGVLTVTSRIVGELRVQQGTRGGNRENQLRGYAGRYMSDEGIQKWIEEQGGLVTLTNIPNVSTDNTRITEV